LPFTDRIVIIKPLAVVKRDLGRESNRVAVRFRIVYQRSVGEHPHIRNSTAYCKLSGRSQSMAVTIDKELCIACGSCVSICPVEIIELAEDAAHLTSEDSCIECGTCVDACVVEAITL